MWVLIVISLHGSTASTQSTLSDCQRELTRVVDAQQAYCKSAVSNDMVWLIKDGRRLIEPRAFQ
jgi:hypothetical protein